MININNALLDPSSVFKSPQDVLHNHELSREQKVDILQRWYYDACLMETAEAENMQGGNSHDVLGKIVSALHELGVKPKNVQ